MDNRKAAEKLLGSIDVDHTQYKFGHTKVCICVSDVHNTLIKVHFIKIFSYGKNRVSYGIVPYNCYTWLLIQKNPIISIMN